MDKRHAKREAYKIASLLIDQAQDSAVEPWEENDADALRIGEALNELSQQLWNRGPG